jgi:hypothetical protein
MPRAATASGQISTTTSAAAFSAHEAVTEESWTTIARREW